MSLVYLFRRIGAVLVVLAIVTVAVFVMTNVLPGNAAMMILGENATPERVEALERQLGLDRPLLVQYFDWVTGMVQGDLGLSLTQRLPVVDIVGKALFNSAELAGIALVGVTIVAIPMGAMAAVHRGRKLDTAISFLSYLGTSIPEFVTATLLLVFLSQPAAPIFPAGGFVAPGEDFLRFLHHAALPAITLGLILTAHIARQVRSEMSEVLGSDYIRAARLKGLSDRRVVWRHALPNSLAPAVAVISLDIGYLLGGIIVVEEIFAWPGLGRLLIHALQTRDLPVIQAITLIMAVVYALSNLLADIVIAKLDPRVRYA